MLGSESSQIHPVPIRSTRLDERRSWRILLASGVSHHSAVPRQSARIVMVIIIFFIVMPPDEI